MHLKLADPQWTDSQRAFLSALDSARASSPDYAMAHDKLPTLPVRELQALVDLGVVREASANSYYIYHRQVLTPPMVAEKSTVFYTATPRRLAGGRLTKSLVFWFIIILIPIILIELMGRNR